MKLNNNNGVVSFSVEPNFTGGDYDSIFKKLEQIENIREIRVDLKDIFYIQSSQISQLIGLKKLADRHSAVVSLLNAGSGVVHVLEMAHLMQFFKFKEDYNYYTAVQLIEMFHNQAEAEGVSEHMAAKYTPAYRDALYAGVRSDDAVIAAYSIQTIGRAHDDEAIPLLREALGSVYPGVVKEATLVLGWMGDTESKGTFYKLLESDDEAVAEAAAASIGLLHDDSDSERLAEIAVSRKPQLRTVVAGVLSMINDDSAFKLLKKMLETETNDGVRRAIVRRVSFFNKGEATDILIKALSGGSRAEQEVAAAGLARTGLRGHDAEVLKKVSGEDNWVAYFAVKALADNLSPDAADEIMRLYPHLEDNVRLAVVEVLGTLNEPDVEIFLEERLTDDNEDIRKEALSSLYKVNPAKGVNRALSLAKKDPCWVVRFVAVGIINSARPEGYMGILKEIRAQDSSRYIQEKISAILGY